MEYISKSPSYLLRVGTTYHFRFVFPKKYCSLFTGEIRMSLKTGALRVARILAATLANKTKNYLRRIDEGNTVTITKQDIKSELGQYLQDRLEEYERIRLEGRNKNISSWSQEVALDKINTDIQKQLLGQEGKHHEDVDKFLQLTGLPISLDDPLYAFTKRELLKLYQAAIKIEKERISGNYNSNTELSILSSYTTHGNVKKPHSKPVSTFIQQYIDESISDGKWAEKTVKEYKNRLGIFTEIINDCNLSDIDYDKTREVFDKLKKIPANRNKVKVYKNKTIAELLDMDLPPEDCMSLTTVNNAMQCVSIFFIWAVKREYMSQNFAAGIKAKTKEKPDELKDAFSDAEVKSVFKGLEIYKQKLKQIHRWWIPFIGLYSGARLEEISQLHISDIRQENDLWIIDINDKEDKRVKTKSSKRLVPIHDQLIKNGFIDYFEQTKSAGHERLFPDLKPLQKKYGHSISKWFGTYLKKQGIKTADKKLSFHSFRHTFVTKAKRSELPESYIQQIVGHANDSMTYGVYGKTYEIPELKGIIDKILFSGLTMEKLH
ncbi:site-specific integrase [Desulfobacula sp.]|uniref:site-specific integrase n=1 Tax=Desulfobacula sp. TaxID=2593537 RepID=UPI00261D3C16|nr:site-specific integrase [Desulfobacula sp.]